MNFHFGVKRVSLQKTRRWKLEDLFFYSQGNETSKRWLENVLPSWEFARFWVHAWSDAKSCLEHLIRRKFTAIQRKSEIGSHELRQDFNYGLMEEIRSGYHHSIGFMHPTWCRTSFINCMKSTSTCESRPHEKTCQALHGVPHSHCWLFGTATLVAMLPHSTLRNASCEFLQQFLAKVCTCRLHCESFRFFKNFVVDETIYWNDSHHQN